MCKRFLTGFILFFLSQSLTFAQVLEANCPALFTHERTINPKINIVNLEVMDSNA